MRHALAIGDEAIVAADDAGAPAAGASPAGGTLVIVGNGMVGHRLCRQLVEHGALAQYHIVVFGEEPSPAYDRVHLTDVLTGRGEAELLLSPAAWYADHGIDLRLGDPVVAIDRRRRIVRAASGAEVEYARLVLATGSSPHVPPIDGATLPRVFVYRTLHDLRAIGAQARHARRGAVIGGGLLGLEAARALQHLGLHVTVIEAAASVMPAQLDQSAGETLKQQIAALGIDVLTGAMTRRIEPHGAQRLLHLAGGATLIVDLVVIATGVRPRSDLAARCDLDLTPEGGIVVDDRLRTSDPHISAIGDCVSHRSRTHGLVSPGYAMADTLARILMRLPGTFAGAIPATRLKLLGVDVAAAGEPLDSGFPVRFRAPGVYRLLRIDRGRLGGALGVGDWPELGRIQEGAGRRIRIWPWQLARFERTGRLWPEAEETPVTAWPARAIVCHCLGVSRGQLSAACAAGAQTVESLVERTGASTMCGTCRPLVEVLAGGSAARGPVSRALLGGSVAALATVVVLLAVAPYPVASSVQAPLPLDFLWRDRTSRQISGFVLLGLSLAASLLPLRKRWRRVSVGAFPSWRLAHVVLGALTLVALAVHTGARLGDNLNAALMASFGTLNVLGGVAGWLTAVEPRLDPRQGRRYRAVLVTVHLLATWPLPVLIVFHVLSTFYF